MTHANPEHKAAQNIISNLNDLLVSHKRPLKRISNTLSSSELPPELLSEISELESVLQEFLTLLGAPPPVIDVAKQQFLPEPNTTDPRMAAVNDQGQDGDKATVSKTEIKPPRTAQQTGSDQILDAPPKRRPRNKGFDLLLLAAPYYQSRYGYLIDHDVLFELAHNYDPSVSRATMVSKTNRYKNDKSWLEWTTSEDIRIGKKGEAAFDKLKLQADREKSLERVKQTFRDVWGIDLPF